MGWDKNSLMRKIKSCMQAKQVKECIHHFLQAPSQVMWLGKANPISQNVLPFSFSPCFIYWGWCHIVGNTPWVSCWGCATSQLLVLSEPFVGGVRKPWCWLSTAQQWLKHPWIINTASWTIPKHGPVPVTREKFTSSKPSTQGIKRSGLKVNKKAKCGEWDLTFLILSKIKERQAELQKTFWRLFQDEKPQAS